MTVEELKRAASELASNDQRHLAAYLIHLDNQRDPALRQELNDRLNNRDPKFWLSVEEFERRLTARD